MHKLTWLFILLLLLVVISPVSAISTELLIGSNNHGLLVGLEAIYNNREMVGFFGYQEDYLKGMVGLNTGNNQMAGYLQGGRNVFVGNVKYQLSAYAGNLDYRENLSVQNKLGFTGDVMQIEGNRGYGVRGEVNIIGSPSFSLAPYYEWRSDKTIQAMLGVGSHAPFIQLQYLTDIDELRTIVLQARLSSYGLESGIELFLEHDLSLSGQYAKEQFGFGIKWLPEDKPFTFSFNWHPSSIQWISSYRF